MGQMAQELSGLRILEMTDTFTHGTSQHLPTSVDAIAHFPPLESSHITDNCNTFSTVQFLQLCSFPATTTLYPRFPRSVFQHYPLLFSLLSATASRIGASFSGCYVTSDYKQDISFSLWANKLPASALRDDTKPTVRGRSHVRAEPRVPLLPPLYPISHSRS